MRDLSHESLEEVPISISTHSLVIMKQGKRNKPGFVLFGSLVSFSFVVVVAIGIVWLVWLFDIRIPVAKADLELAILSKLAASLPHKFWHYRIVPLDLAIQPRQVLDSLSRSHCAEPTTLLPWPPSAGLQVCSGS